MKGSGLEGLIRAAFSDLTSMLSCERWSHAMQALWMVCAVVLSDFLSGDGSNRTLDYLAVYLGEAWKTASGRLWVDCLIQPTFVVHLTNVRHLKY